MAGDFYENDVQMTHFDEEELKRIDAEVLRIIADATIDQIPDSEMEAFINNLPSLSDK